MSLWAALAFQFADKENGFIFDEYTEGFVHIQYIHLINSVLPLEYML